MTLLRSEDGSALVEVAIALPLMTLLLVGAIDYGVYVERKLQVTEAASAAAAYGAISANSRNTSGMQTAARNASPSLTNLTITATAIWSCSPNGAQVTSSTSCANYGTPIQYVQVRTSASVSAPISFTGLPSSMTVNGQATYRVAWKP